MQSSSKSRKVKVVPKSFLEEYLTFGELAGRIPQSLMVNVNFEQFAQENGFEPID